MSFVEYHIVPSLSFENVGIPTGKSIRRDANVEVVLVVPALPKLLPPLGRAVIA